MEPAVRVYECAVVKWIVTIAAIVLVAAWIDGTALAHPDTFGTPDPSWQRTASGSPGTGGQVATDGTASTDGATHPEFLRGYVYVASALLVLLALGLVRSFWLSSRRSAS